MDVSPIKAGIHVKHVIYTTNSIHPLTFKYAGGKGEQQYCYSMQRFVKLFFEYKRNQALYQTLKMAQLTSVSRNDYGASN
jgi:hypothetical protein